jgi:uncharacterized protein
VRLPDVNLLLYAVDEQSPRHAAARGWLEDRLSGTETVAFGWSTLNGFLRISTRAAVFQRPLSVAQAFDLVAGWLDRTSVIVVHPSDRHLQVMRELLEPLGTAANLVPDAHLAALAIEHGATLESCDHDFARFVGLRWADPLAA